MSKIFTVCSGVDLDTAPPDRYFTTDRRTARRLARDSGVRFRVLRGERQVCYGGGDRPETQIADSVLATANG